MLYSLVIPTFNSAPFIHQTLEAVQQAVHDMELEVEVIVVDDGSRDETWARLTALKSQFDFQAIRLTKNYGQHAATICGFQKAKGEYIITLDDDLQIQPKNIRELIDQMEKEAVDVVYGQYKNLRRGFVRKVFYYSFRFLSRLVEGKDKISGSSFRLIHHRLAKLVSKNASEFTFIDELVVWNTSKIGYALVPHHAGLRAKSNYSIFHLYRMFRSLSLVSSMFHIRMVKLIGTLFAFGSIGYGCFILYKKLFLDNFSVQGYASIMVLITFSVGLILYSLAVIGEYLVKIFRAAHRAPVYRIDEEV